jgi:hypothetical protein
VTANALQRSRGSLAKLGKCRPVLQSPRDKAALASLADGTLINVLLATDP